MYFEFYICYNIIIGICKELSVMSGLNSVREENKKYLRRFLVGDNKIPKEWNEDAKYKFNREYNKVKNAAKELKQLKKQKDKLIKEQKKQTTIAKRIKLASKDTEDKIKAEKKKIRIETQRINKALDRINRILSSHATGDGIMLPYDEYEKLHKQREELKIRRDKLNPAINDKLQKLFKKKRELEKKSKVDYKDFFLQKSILNSKIQLAEKMAKSREHRINKSTKKLAKKYSPIPTKKTYEEFIKQYDAAEDIGDTFMTSHVESKPVHNIFGVTTIYSQPTHVSGVTTDPRVYLIGFLRHIKDKMKKNKSGKYRIYIYDHENQATVFSSVPITHDFDEYDIFSRVVNIELYKMGIWSFRLIQLPLTATDNKSGAGNPIRKLKGCYNYEDYTDNKYCGQICLMLFDYCSKSRSRFIKAKDKTKIINKFIKKHNLPSTPFMSFSDMRSFGVTVDKHDNTNNIKDNTTTDTNNIKIDNNKKSKYSISNYLEKKIDKKQIKKPLYDYDEINDVLYNINGNTKKKGILLYNKHYYLMLNTEKTLSQEFGYLFCAKHNEYHKKTHKCHSHICDECGMSYKTKSSLTRHTKLINTTNNKVNQNKNASMSINTNDKSSDKVNNNTIENKNGKNKTIIIDGVCEHCNKKFKYIGCAKAHKCKNTHWCNMCHRQVKNNIALHQANGCYTEIKCGNCGKFDNCNTHRCQLRLLGNKKLKNKNNNTNNIKKDKNKTNTKKSKYKYYVYDIESYNEANGKQEFAMAWIMSLDRKEKIFIRTAKEFTNWCVRQKSPTILFAHNGGKYDNIIMREKLIREGLTPSNVCQAGYKIIQFKAKNVIFRDTIAHISMPLSKMPSAFGVESKKTIFPYSFYNKRNAFYKGDIPIEYYNECDREEVKKRALNIRCDIDVMCREYCKNDTELLAMCVEKYRESMIQLTGGVDPLNYITKASYAYAVYRTKFMSENSISYLQPHAADFIRKGFAGGRSNCLVKKYVGKLRAKDVSSLYPAVQKYDLLPGVMLGYYRNSIMENMMLSLPPKVDTTTNNNITNKFNNNITNKSTTNSINKNIKKTKYIIKRCNEFIKHQLSLETPIVGFYECDIIPPKDIYIPVLGVKRDKYIFDNNFIHKKVYYSTELKLAIDNGYIIDRIYDYIEFRSTTSLFSKFVDTFYKEKQRYKTENNPAMYNSIKILLNSLWGKFGEANRYFETYIIRSCDIAVRNKLIEDELNNKCRLIGESVVETSDGKDAVLIATYKKLTSTIKQTKGSIAVAAAITANGRVRLYEALKYYNRDVLYFDTDSIYHKVRDDINNDDDKVNGDADDFKSNYPHVPGGIGDWEKELDGDEFISIGAKMYGVKQYDISIDSGCDNNSSNMCKNSKTIIKAKGIPKNIITYNIIDDIVNDNIDVYNCQYKKFVASRVGVSVINGLKIISDTCNKRIYNVDKNGNHYSVPFGSLGETDIINNLL